MTTTSTTSYGTFTDGYYTTLVPIGGSYTNGYTDTSTVTLACPPYGTIQTTGR